MWMAIIHWEILLSVCGFDVQVSAYQTIPEIDPHIEEGDFFGQPKSCKFNCSVVMVKVLNDGL